MKHRSKQLLSILLTLALVLGLLPGMSLTAYAEELSESFETNKRLNTYTGEHFTIWCEDKGDNDGFYLRTEFNHIATISSRNGEIITKAEFTRGWYNINNFRSEAGTVTYDGDVATVTGINATSLTIGAAGGLNIKAVKVYWAHVHDFTYEASGATITATCEGSGTCDITEGLTLTISAPTGNLVYDGTTTFAATLSTGYNTTAFPDTYTISYTKDGSAYSGVPKDAGAYTASVTVGTGDAAKTASVDFIIAKAVPTINTAPTAGEITYGQTLANSNLTGGTASVSGDFAWKDPTVAPAVSDSQKTEYDVVFTPKDENYDKAECKVKLTVNKTEATVTKAPEAKALTYTGSAQELVTAGTATGGEMQYALGTATEATEPYTTSIPAKTEAGTYYVWYKVKGNENHNDSAPQVVTVVIAAQNTYTVTSTFYFRKVWEGSAEKSIDFTLYSADGKVNRQGFEKHILSEKEWSYSAVFNEAGSCYVVEKPIPGYITRYVNVGKYAGVTDRCCNGGTIINKRIPKTGDEAPLLLWAVMFLTGAAGLTVALTVNKRRKAHK